MRVKKKSACVVALVYKFSHVGVLYAYLWVGVVNNGKHVLDGTVLSVSVTIVYLSRMILVSATNKGESFMARSPSEIYKSLPISVSVSEARVHLGNVYSLVRYIIWVDEYCA